MSKTNMKTRKCKDCGISFIPNARFEPRCFKCKIAKFNEQKAKYCDYKNKTLITRTKKPQKPLQAKVGAEQGRINKIVRERDAGKPCVSCGRINYEIQAGHFHSRNQCSKLRYDLSNIHGQCGKCNSMMTQNPEIPQNYRIEIEKRIGSEELARIDKIKSEAGTIIIGKFD
jgi:5-methylcytosine-specific restriction endonuclease McrA